jgi:hypothetical protein
MKEKTSQFWFMATVVLAAMYLISNPAMTSKAGSQLSEFWQAVISRVKAPEPLANTEQTGQHSLARQKQMARAILEQPEHKISDAKEETAPQQDEKVGENGEGHERVDQKNQPHGSEVPEVKMQDVLISQKGSPQPEVSGKVSMNEKYIPLEALKEIYAKHLEALKILNSNPGSEKNEK